MMGKVLVNISDIHVETSQTCMLRFEYIIHYSSKNALSTSEHTALNCDWILGQKHNERSGVKDGPSWTFWHQFNSDINACLNVAKDRYCDIKMAHICCVYMPVQFLIHHRRIIFVVSVWSCHSLGLLRLIYCKQSLWTSWRLGTEGGRRRRENEWHVLLIRIHSCVKWVGGAIIPLQYAEKIHSSL